MAMQLRVYVDRAHRELLVSLAGELDLATAQRLTEALDAFAAQDFDRCLVDISEVTFCDCAGLNALLVTYQAITDAGGHPMITGARRQVTRIAAIAGCGWLFTPSVVEAPKTPIPSIGLDTLISRAIEPRDVPA
jgi:anti-sigma B factor antagonist